MPAARALPPVLMPSLLNDADAAFLLLCYLPSLLTPPCRPTLPALPARAASLPAYLPACLPA